MVTKITMPPGGQTTNESLIVKWHKVVGDNVKKGDVLFEIETDKAVMEIESFTDGILLAARYAEGEYASTGEVVAYIGNEGERIPDDFIAHSGRVTIEKETEAKEIAVKYATANGGKVKEAIAKEIGVKEAEAKEEVVKETAAKERTVKETVLFEEDEYQPIIKKEDSTKFQKESFSSKAPASEGFAPGSTAKESFSSKAQMPESFAPNVYSTGTNITGTLASPAARLIAKQEKIEINTVSKAFPGQIVKRADVESYIKKNIAKAEVEKSYNSEDFHYVETTSMRKTIARRMAESVSTAPVFYVTVEVDMTNAIKLRVELNDYLKVSEVKVSFNDIIMKCASKAIEKFPLINSTYGEDRIKVYNNVNFGLAVGLDKGLLVPVVRGINRKSLSEIARENAENIVRAKNGKLKTEQMSGATITLSNLGMFGVECFTAIISQPESCILAVGSIIEKPVIMDGAVVPRHMMSITATFDHRVIDGNAGAEFLREVRTLLEKPQLLLV